MWVTWHDYLDFVHHEDHPSTELRVNSGHEGFSKGGFETRPYNFVLFVSFVVKAVFASLVAASRCWFSVVNTDSNLHGS